MIRSEINKDIWDEYYYDENVVGNSTITEFDITDESMFISTDTADLGAYLNKNTIDFHLCSYVHCCISDLIVFLITLNPTKMFLMSKNNTYFLGYVPPHLQEEAINYCNIANELIKNRR